MGLGKHPAVVDESYRSFQEGTAGALDNKENLLLETDTADNTVKLNTSTDGATVIGVMVEKLQGGTGRVDDIRVRMLGKEGTIKVVQNAAINYGARVMVDPSSPTKVIAVPATAGRYRSLGKKVSQGGGAAGDIIEIDDLVEWIVVSGTLTLTSATTANATDLATSEALANALKADLAAIKTLLQGAGIAS